MAGLTRTGNETGDLDLQLLQAHASVITESSGTLDTSNRPHNQEDCVDNTLYKQMGAASRFQALVLTEDISHGDICWRDSTVGLEQSRRFP